MTTVVLAAILATQASAPPPKFDSGRAWEHLRQLVAIGPRPSGSPAIEQARTYIKEQLAAAGLTPLEQTWEEQTPIDKVRMVNLAVTIPGARKERIVIAGHYDTKLYRQFRFVGASDGGSSAAFLLELARVLKGRRNPMTIELLFLDGEEARLPDWSGTDNTYGSRHYVEAARRDGSNIVWETAKRQDLDDYFVADSTRVEDDHLPFLAAGVPSVDIIDLDYEAWHTSKDTLDACSARSLQVVGDVLLAALPQIEVHLTKAVVLTGGRRVHGPKRNVHFVHAKRKVRPRDRLKEKTKSSMDLAH